MNYVLGLGGHCCSGCSADDACKEKPTITSGGTASGTAGSAFSFSITATQSPTSYAVSGTLPPGTSLNTSSGVISGTPSSGGTFNVLVTATNACGTSASEGLTITITAPPCPPPVITSPTTASGAVGVAFSYSITATNSPNVFNATGLPSGLAVNAGTGVINGTPSEFGTFSITLYAYNDCEGGEDTSPLTLVIGTTDCPMPTLVCDSIEASKSKCGWTEVPGYESTPPKYYLTQEWFGQLYELVWNAVDCSVGSADETVTTFPTGSATYDRFTCALTGDFLINGVSVGTSSSIGTFLPCAGVECVQSVSTMFGIHNEVFPPDGVCYGSFPAHLYYTSGGSPPTASFYGEYTTAQLIADAESLLPGAYPGTWGGSCTAVRDLDEDEISYTVRRFKYKFQLPDLSGYTMYKITWMEGGTPMEYNWNGTDTETPEYGPVMEPGSNGEVGVTDIALLCG